MKKEKQQKAVEKQAKKKQTMAKVANREAADELKDKAVANNLNT